MQELIDMLKERGLVSKADNLQQELDILSLKNR